MAHAEFASLAPEAAMRRPGASPATPRPFAFVLVKLASRLTILRATNAQEARALAEADPFVTNGLRTFELKEWIVMEGSIGLKINLSDQSVEVA